MSAMLTLRLVVQCASVYHWHGVNVTVPWRSLSPAAGPLLQPRGQSSVFYTIPPADTQQQGSNSQPAATAQSGGEAGDNSTQEKQPVAVKEQQQQQQQADS
jgi:hypothetical protein